MNGEELETTTPAANAPAGDPAPDAGAVNPDGGAANTPPAVDNPSDAAAPGGQVVTLDGKDNTGTGGEATGAEGDAGGEDGGNDGDDAGGEPAPFAYPDGMAGDPEAETALRAFAKERNLPPEDQQALVDIQVAMEQRRNAVLVEQLQEMKAGWARDLAADPEFGGAHLPQTGKDANLGLRHYAPELIPLLPQWHLDTQIDLVKHFARLGRGLRENKSPKADNPGTHRPMTLVDSKAKMLADQEKAAAARRP